jgi:hypothetical protein
MSRLPPVPSWLVALAAGAGFAYGLSTGDGGTVVVGSQVVRTGPVPAWLVRALYSPPGWLLPVTAVLAVLCAALAYGGYRNHGVDDEVRREALSNGVVVGSMGGLTLLLAATALVPPWASVVAGCVLGFPLALRLQGRLGLDGGSVD